MAFFTSLYSGKDLEKSEPQSFINALQKTGKIPSGEIEFVIGVNLKGFAILTDQELIYAAVNEKHPEKGFYKAFQLNNLESANIRKGVYITITLNNETTEFKKISAFQKDIDNFYNAILSKIKASVGPVAGSMPELKLKDDLKAKFAELGFKATKVLVRGSFLTGPTIYIDEEHYKWALLNSKKQPPKIYNYSDVLDFDISENGGSIAHGHIGSAIVGGLAFGAVGAVVGASRSKKIEGTCNSLKVVITVNDPQYPNITIPLIFSQTKTSSLSYQLAKQNAENIASMLTLMQNRGAPQPENTAQPILTDSHSANDSPIEKIKKLAELHNSGILTDEEFESKKKELLSQI